jgi:ADP-heptose:LPS heptosyltransferase
MRTSIPTKTSRWAKDTIRSFLLPWRKSIHIYRGAGLGDVLMCTPALRKLKQINPECKIYFYTDYPDLVKGLWYLDAVLSSDKQPPKPMQMGYEDVKIPRRHLSKIMGAKIGVRVEDVKPDCVLDERLAEQFRIAWQKLPRPRILVQRRAGNHTPNKNWPDESWQALLEGLLRTCTIIEIGAMAEVPAISSPHYVDLRDKTSLAELVAAVAAADIFVGPDSGPVHIAAAVKTPAVVILGGYVLPANIEYAGNQILYTPLSCSPCWLKTPCPIDRECLRRIAPEKVKEAIDRTWNSLNAMGDIQGSVLENSDTVGENGFERNGRELDRGQTRAR